MDGVTLEYDKGALDAIVDTAVEYKLGARGLRSIMENIMNDLMFDLPNKEEGSKVRITKKLALEQINKASINPTLKQ
jgi:ATP-dependent Clp protease ATP-binding subunit ClpX